MIVISELEQLISQVADWQSEGAKVGVVPTMGGLHRGHLSLVEESNEHSDRTIATVFVNPLQFGEGEDFSAYPRRLKSDIELLREYDCDLVFAPTEQEMFGESFSTSVEVSGLTEPLCGAHRPGFFKGITTELCRLFNYVPGSVVFLGEKDYQQYLVVRKMVSDLNMPINLRVCKTVRDQNGLALSSRNEYLSPSQKKVASHLFGTLSHAAERIGKQFENSIEYLEDAKRELLEHGFSEIEYLELRDEFMEAPTIATDQTRLYAACKLGSVRLIDNVSVTSLNMLLRVH